MAEPRVHCDLWGDGQEDRDGVVNDLRQHMQHWQSSEIRSKLSVFLQRTPFFERQDVLAVSLHLYSAGRRHIGYAEQPWQQEISSGDRVFRADVQHDGHMNVTCLHSEKRYYWPNSQVHHVSGLHPVLQQQIVKHEKFTECFLLLLEKMARTFSGVRRSGKQENHFVISCNAGCQRSVAMVCIMEAVLRKGGWTNITANHLHLWGCNDPYVANSCCQCRDCQVPDDVPVDVVQSGYQQRRVVCC